MNKRLQFSLVIVIFISMAAQEASAITTYNITIGEADALMNITFELYTSSPEERVNYWTTSFSLPARSQVIDIRDSKGAIKNYTIQEEKVILETNKGGLKEKEVVTMLVKVSQMVSNEYSPLKKINLSLSAFGNRRQDVPDEQTFVSVATAEEIHSFSSSLGFISQIKEKGIKFAGSGPLALTLFFGKGGKEYDHYVLFGNGDFSAADDAFGILPAILGFVPEFRRFPVVILSDNEYDKKVNDWSAGEYRSGVILLRQSAMSASSSLVTILHETSHGFHERALRWQKTRVTWFDEGVAKYVEFLVNKKAGSRQAEIFGEPLRWQEGLKIYTLPPRSTPDELWQYYQRGDTFMESWNPANQQTREFGYAFSELMIRDFIRRNSTEALHEVFQKMLKIKEDVQTDEEYNRILLQFLQSDFKPCYSASKKAFESCLEEINNLNPPIPENVTIKGVSEDIIIPIIQAPAEESYTLGILEKIISAISSFFSALRDILKI